MSTAAAAASLASLTSGVGFWNRGVRQPLQGGIDRFATPYQAHGEHQPTPASRGYAQQEPQR